MNVRTEQIRLAICEYSKLICCLVAVGGACLLSLPGFGQGSNKQAKQTIETIQSTQRDQTDKNPKTKTDFLGDPLPPHALVRLGTKRFNPSQVNCVVLSADERIVVSFNKELKAWDALTGKLLWNKSASIPRGGISAAAYGSRPCCRMPVSGELVALGQTGVIEFWDFATGDKVTRLTDFQESFKSIDVSPDESLFALGGANLLLVCDQSGKEKYRLENQPKNGIGIQNSGDRLRFGGEFSYARFSPDGNSLALVNSESPKTIQILNAESGDVRRRIETTGRVVRMDFSKDSQRIVTTERDITARMYNVENGEQIWVKIFSIPGLDERYTTDVEHSPDGKIVAVGTAIGEDQRIQLLDSKTGETVGALKGHTWKPWSLKFNADGTQLYSAGWDGVIRRWDIEKREQIRIENSERASGVCTIAPDGATVAFCDDSGLLHVVDTKTGKKLHSFGFEDTTFGQAIYSQDGQRLAAGGSDRTDMHVYVWNVDSGELLHHWDWPKGRDAHTSVESLSFSKNANRLAVAAFRQSACYVFDLPTDKQISKVSHRMVYGLSMSSDGKQFVSAGWDKSIRLWNCETGEEENSVEVASARDPRMYGVLFSPDGKTIASLSLGGEIRTWDRELKEIADFKIKSRAVYGSFQFSRNGLWIGVGQMNGQTHVYELSSGEVVWGAARHDKNVYNVEFGEDDRTLLTGADDGVCYLWDLGTASGRDSIDFEELANQLVGESPSDAFNAYQSLMAEPKKALGAIGSAMETYFSEWGKPDDMEIAKRIERIHRVTTFLAQTDVPEAGELFDNLLKNSPNVLVKKAIFLESRQREKFMNRENRSSDK